MLVFTNNNPITDALTKCREIVQTTSRRADGDVFETRLLKAEDGSELRVLDTDQGGQEVLGLVKQLDWLANYPKLWSRLQKLDVESISAFVRDFEGKSAVLPFTQAYVPTSLSERMLYGKVWVRSVGTQTTDRGGSIQIYIPDMIRQDGSFSNLQLLPLSL